ncbi:MAG TPA: aldo/keto reductase [Galbitalea sp.]|jgi:2,5-diketo-D-gluconate reductase A
MIPSVALNTGHSIPQIGLGTWPLDDAEIARVIPIAAELGYRHIDTATAYGNEAGVGEGIRRTGIDRSEFFVTTKLDLRFQGDDKAIAGLTAALERMKLDYVDLVLLHWPAPWEDKFVSTWKTFELLYARGLSRSIGVSNFKPAHLERLAEETGTVPAVNQIQLHPRITRVEQRAYDSARGIVTESYSPLGGQSDRFLATPLLAEIGARHGKTPGQVVLRWHVQNGLVPLPKSANPVRLAENIDVFDFELTDTDLADLSSLDGGPGAGVDSDQFGH